MIIYLFLNLNKSIFSVNKKLMLNYKRKSITNTKFNNKYKNNIKDF